MSIEKRDLPLEIRGFQKNIKALDLGPIAYNLMQGSGGGWTREQTTRAIARYLMFLCLIYLYPNRPVVPTPEIDAVWHQHILDTSKYAADCQQLFGRFVHHFPYFGRRGQGDRASLQAAFAETQALFEERFGSETLAEAAPDSEDNKSPQPADCEPLGSATKIRPTADIQIADALQVLPPDWLEFLG